MSDETVALAVVEHPRLALQHFVVSLPVALSEVASRRG